MACGLQENESLKSLQISGCNLASGNSTRLLCEGLKENHHIKYLDLSCNELRDEHGQLIIDAVKVLAEKRDHLQWMEGLRGRGGKKSASKEKDRAGQIVDRKNENVINIEIQNVQQQQS